MQTCSTSCSVVDFPFPEKSELFLRRFLRVFPVKSELRISLSLTGEGLSKQWKASSPTAGYSDNRWIIEPAQPRAVSPTQLSTVEPLDTFSVANMLLYLLTWVASFLIVLAATFSLAVALYFLAEIVEENSMTAAKVIRLMIVIDAVLFVLLPIFEHFPIMLIIGGLLAQLCHFQLMRTFPAIQLKSPWFAGTVVMFLFNHYVAFRHFTEQYYPFNEAFTFFFLFMWLVPMSLLVSLSANDMVLPTYSDSTSSLGRGNDDNFLNNQRRKQGSSLKTFLTYIKEEYLPMVGLGARKSF